MKALYKILIIVKNSCNFLNACKMLLLKQQNSLIKMMTLHCNPRVSAKVGTRETGTGTGLGPNGPWILSPGPCNSEMLSCKSWHTMIFHETFRDFPTGDHDTVDTPMWMSTCRGHCFHGRSLRVDSASCCPLLCAFFSGPQLSTLADLHCMS